jgi:sulfate adenylyltransferase
MAGLVGPHGGELVSRLVPKDQVQERMAEAQGLAKVQMTSREVSDVIMIGIGAFSPITGFMGQADYKGSMTDMRLASGTLWPVPITLSTDKETADGIKDGQKVALVDDESGDIMATMAVAERFTYDKQEEARNVFRTDDGAHPGVAKVYDQGDVCLAGEVDVLSEGGYPERFAEYARPPETRKIFEERDWTTVAAFQTRNPLHRSHEYLTKVALEVSDGVLIHPIVGKLKEGDIPADIRMKCYDVLLENYYPSDRVVLKVYPMEMRYGGPREAILHAVIRQNFGCSHLCVGRDHAGVGDYYGPFDAQKIFDEIKPADLQIRPLKFENTFYCTECEAMGSIKICTHDKKNHIFISGTKTREMLSRGEDLPREFSRPEVAAVLMEYYQSLAK